MIIEQDGKSYQLILTPEHDRRYWEEVNCTCLNCQDKLDCPFAFDDYNLDGECLAEK